MRPRDRFTPRLLSCITTTAPHSNKLITGLCKNRPAIQINKQYKCFIAELCWPDQSDRQKLHDCDLCNITYLTNHWTYIEVGLIWLVNIYFFRGFGSWQLGNRLLEVLQEGILLHDPVQRCVGCLLTSYRYPFTEL